MTVLDGAVLPPVFGGFPDFYFAECFFQVFLNTRQMLYRILDKKHSAKSSLSIFFLPSAKKCELE
jgi:hypothetical protein